MNEILGAIGATLLALLLLAAITPSEKQMQDWQTQTVGVSKQKIFNSSITYLQNRGFNIDKMNANTGFLKTGWSSQYQLKGVWGVVEEAIVGETRSAVTVLITPIKNNNCKVRVNLIAQERVEGSFIWSSGHWKEDPLYYGKNNYNKFFDGLRDVIKR